MTPCEERNYNVGDLFRVVKPDDYPSKLPAFTNGSVIRLEVDDGSYYPFFTLVEGHCNYEHVEGGKPGAYQHLEYVHPISRPQEIRKQLRVAIARLEDMLQGDDAQAWDEAEKALPAMKRALGDHE